MADYNAFDHMLQTHRFDRTALQFGPGKSPGNAGRMDYSQVWAGDAKDIRQDYWNQQYEETPYKTSPLSGVGWMPVNQAWNRKQFLLPDQAPADQPWRTKWVASPFSPSLMGPDGLGGGPSHSWDDLRWKMNQPEAYGWRPGKDLTTGRVRSYDPSFSPDIDDVDPTPYGSRWASEVLDFDKYNDPNDYYYGSAKKGMGINKYSTLQQILDASAWHAGTWNQPEPPKTTTTGSPSTSTSPKLLDVSGTPQAVGGVNASNTAALNKTIADLQKQISQQKTTYDTQLNQQRSHWEKSLQDMAAAWGAKSQKELSDLSTRWGSRYDKQQASYNTRIADLTSGWNQQSADYTSKIGNLNQSLTDSRKLTQDYLGQVKSFKEQQLKDIERQRTAATWGWEGKPMNRSVGGVASGKATQLGGDKVRSSIRDNFNRQGLRISSLNV